MKTRIVAIILIILYLSSCKTKYVHVPVETVKTEYRNNYVRDSIMSYDSIFVKEKGDTIRIEKYRYLYRDKIVRDTLMKCDTISVIVPVPGPEVNRLKNWQIILMCIGSAALAGGVIYMLKKIRLF